MIDFHSHVLPHIDDGAHDIEMSLEMLRESKRQNVDTVVATPHCYITDESKLEHYIQKRKERFEELKKAIAKSGEDLPELKLGCEVRMMKLIDDIELLRPLCIENTDYILIEMPSGKWNVNDYDALYRILLKGMKPIMAHIERFWDQKDEFYNLYSLELVYQINADALLNRPYKSIIPKLFEAGAVHIMGSDMHNMDTRKTCMAEAAQKITQVYGEDRLEYLMNNAQNVLENKKVKRKSFEKLTFFERLKI